MFFFSITHLQLMAKIAEFPVKFSPRIVSFLIFGFCSTLICRQINGVQIFFQTLVQSW